MLYPQRLRPSIKNALDYVPSLPDLIIPWKLFISSITKTIQTFSFGTREKNKEESSVARVRVRVRDYVYIIGLDDSDYAGFTTRHLHQRIVEYKNSAIGKHFSTAHGKTSLLKESQFRIIKNC